MAVAERRKTVDERIHELEEALSFYARRSNWWGPRVIDGQRIITKSSTDSPVRRDGGERARKALGRGI